MWNIFDPLLLVGRRRCCGPQGAVRPGPR